MTTVADLLKTLEKVDVGFEAEEAINKTAETIVAKQKDQLLHGLREDGSLIGEYKNNGYAAKKFSMNPLAGLGNMDWKLTGDTYKSIFVDVREDIYLIEIADHKAASLFERFGDPTGLTGESQDDYVEKTLEPQFMGQIHEVTGL